MEALALLAALALAGTAVVRRTAAVPHPSGELANEPQLALERPRPFPISAPRGQEARDMRMFDAWVDHPGYAVTPQGILATYREAERGYPQRQCDLFDDLIENDAHLRNLFEQREQAVAGKPWVVQAGGTEADEQLGARIMSEALRRLPMVALVQHLLTVNRYGWAAVELDWGVITIEGQAFIAPVWMTPVPARRFRISASTTSPGALDELRLYTDPQRPFGDELSRGKWLVLRRSSTWLARSGLMRTAAWPAMAKRLGFRDWMIYSQRFGLPLPIVGYDQAEVDDDTLATAETILQRIGSDGGAIVPNKLKLDFHDATRGNAENSKAHGGLIAHCNAEMSKLINGSTLSNDNAGSGGASYALGEVHASTKWDNVLFDNELVQEAFRNQVGGLIMRFNNLTGASPLLRIQVVRDLDPKQRAEIADIFQNKLGIKVSKGQLQQELGFREPAGDDDAAPGVTPPTPATPAEGAAA